MKHTQGPWTVKSLDAIGTYYIPQCATSEAEAYESATKVEQANSALISAAPEMLQALEIIKGLEYAFNGDSAFDAEFEKIKNLINKAKGE